MRIRIVVLAFALGLLAGCCEKEPPKPDMTIYPSRPGLWHKEEWGGHVYILHDWGQQGGMVHDPDCLFCRYRKHPSWDPS